MHYRPCMLCADARVVAGQPCPACRGWMTVSRDGITRLGEIGEAVFSADGAYRYCLGRRWGLDDRPVLCCIGLNPSTADEKTDDATIRLMRGVAVRAGCRGLCMLNAFALISADPSVLAGHPDPVGPEGDQWLEGLAADGPVVLAWGAGGALRDRDAQVLAMLGAAGITPVCLGVTRGGFPRHPRGVRRDAPLIPYAGRPAPRGL